MTEQKSSIKINSQSNDDIKRNKYEKSVENYYIKKGLYEKKLNDLKKSKKFKDLTLEQKKESLAIFHKKRRCIYCNKVGGTIFSKKDKHLLAKCGNINEPCNLNIDIKTASTTNAVKTIEEARISINTLKKNITQLKLDLLFELDNEEVILNEFQNQKDELENILSFVVEFKEYFDNQNNKIAIKSEETGENVYFPKKTQIIEKQKQLNQLISTFKKNIKMYKENNEKSILTDSLQIYKNIIIPLQNDIRNIKYQEIFIEKTKNSNGKFTKKTMPTYHFTPRIISDENKILKADDFDILQNTIK
jgi:hypothetical protein